MSRSLARKGVYKLVFERLFHDEKNETTFESLANEAEVLKEKPYIDEVYSGINENFDVIKRAIQRNSNGFSVDRIYKADLAALIVASYEILFKDDIDDKICVNEALEIVKSFSTEKSIRFVNGVLASIIKNKDTVLLDDEEESEEENGGEESEKSEVLQNDDAAETEIADEKDEETSEEAVKAENSEE